MINLKFLKKSITIIYLICFSVIFCACNISEKFENNNEIPDYEIYNQVLYQVGYYGIYVFADPLLKNHYPNRYRHSFDKNETDLINDKLIHLKIDTSDYNCSELTISSVPDSLYKFTRDTASAKILIDEFFKIRNLSDEFNFESKKSIPLRLENLNVPKFTLLTQEHDKLFNPDSNRQFTYYVLSRIILNKSNNIGIFYMSYTAGHLCGGGFIFLICKINGAWKIVKSKQIWIS